MEPGSRWHALFITSDRCKTNLDCHSICYIYLSVCLSVCNLSMCMSVYDLVTLCVFACWCVCEFVFVRLCTYVYVVCVYTRAHTCTRDYVAILDTHCSSVGGVPHASAPWRLPGKWINPAFSTSPLSPE